jgi:hypothetical protein
MSTAPSTVYIRHAAHSRANSSIDPSDDLLFLASWRASFCVDGHVLGIALVMRFLRSDDFKFSIH